MDKAVVHIIRVDEEITSRSLKVSLEDDAGCRQLTRARCNSNIPGTLDILPRIRSCFGF